MSMTPKEIRFARQIFVVGLSEFILSWFRVVSPIAGRIGLVIGMCGGAIARGFDAPRNQTPDKTNDPK
jgi:hypothetical protein